MRLMPILTAALVSVSLYFLIFERETVLAIAQVDTAEDTGDPAAETGPDPVSVVVETSQAQPVDSAVVLRGRTEAARQVTVAAETSGQVVSEPIRKGAFVEAGDPLCELDPGTRQSTLEEARGRLREARARLPEAQARVPEAEAR
ncbi:biotin/lipoyl-binding protein, partial [Salibaculum halophilum]|uniref:biotin/lipoyl-binding protein n=1 Tax=Salibaculum halophilum TaxID=1914408 RepID=UPI001179A975